jgi:ATP-dependent DNA helicase RecQ
MQRGFVCAAGIDVDSKAHIRPELPILRLPASLTATYGGPFDIATEIDLGKVSDIGSAPEIEDREFNIGSLVKVRDVPASEFWRLLERACSRDLRTIFGSDLQATMKTYCLQEKTGIASLGCIVPKRVFDLRVAHEDYEGETKTRIRMQCDFGEGPCFPVVNDLRLYEPDQETPKEEVVRELGARLKRGASVILSVGVTRPWGSKHRHWFQVNGIHLADNPTWRLADEKMRSRDHRMKSIKEALKKHWGYDGFLPLQEKAIECVLAGRDSVVVLPTGGGKSICFQSPAVTLPGLAVVISPLISLMKDQVDSLTECGIGAGRLDSSLTSRERDAVLEQIRKRSLRLLYVSPERMVMDRFIAFLQQQKVSLIAVDEAHCISVWGHDFRPEYRQLGILKGAFPGVAVHAYTASATEQVRSDIAGQLHLEQPEFIVGSFDRPNLNYRVERRSDVIRQVKTVLERHPGESGIVYCIRRTDVDEMCRALNELGYNTVPYHAGMDDEARRRNQDAFAEERANAIVATIAFGMGIDKPNVRYVIHAGMPKSLEHYHQESGRAGRDGLEAECLLIYSGGDYGVWSSIMRDMEPAAKEIALRKLNDMYGYCTGVTCRHRAILNYFGQDLKEENCAACDVCLGNLACMEDSLATAQKILSCVVRLNERFGADYTTSVLIGSEEQRILASRHNKLSTYGLLSDYSKRVVRDWVEQLVGQGYARKEGEFNVLKLTPSGRGILKGMGQPRLLKPAEKPVKVSRAAHDSWENVDKGLFEELRKLRRRIADRREVPAYIVFGDAALRDMARRRPGSDRSFLLVRGVGEVKCAQYASEFLKVIKSYCKANSLALDQF